MKNKLIAVAVLLFLMAGISFKMSDSVYAASDNCICSSGSYIPFKYDQVAKMTVSDADACKRACMPVNNAKYYSFSNVENIGYRRIYNCLCVNGSSIPFYYPLENKYDMPNEDNCNQQCANNGTKYYSYSDSLNLGTKEVTKKPSAGTAGAGKTGCSQCDSSGDPLSCYRDCAGASGCSQCNSSGDPLSCYRDCANPPSPVASNNSTVGASTTRTSTTTTFINPLKYTTVEDFLAHILSVGRNIVVTLAIVFMVVGALMYVLAGADPDLAKKGKSAISGALIGVAIAVAAPSFLKEIGTVLGWNGVNNGAIGSETLSLTQIATNALKFLMSILGVISLIMMIIASIFYLTSAGDSKRIETGKNMFKYAILGILIAMSSLVIVRQLAQFFV